MTNQIHQGPTLDPLRVYNARQVADLLGVHVSTIYAWLKTDPNFPKPARLGEKAVRWTSGQIAEYINARSTAGMNRAA